MRIVGEKILLVALAAASVSMGCRAEREKRAREYMPDMVRSPSYKAFAPNLTTRTGLTLQRPVDGTIARGHQPFHYGVGEIEAARAGRELRDPFHPTQPVLQEGKALFQIYCAICHGEQGKGDGQLAGKIPPPPAYKSERVLAFPPGRIFHVITTGSGKMPSYATQLRPDDRWKIVTYVRTLLQGLPELPVSGTQGV